MDSKHKDFSIRAMKEGKRTESRRERERGKGEGRRWFWKGIKGEKYYLGR